MMPEQGIQPIKGGWPMTRNDANRRVVEALWRRFDAADFAVGDLLHDDFVGEWPLSRERIRGRENFIAVNAHYPGRWRIRVERMVVSEEDSVVVTVAALTNAEHAAETAQAVSFFELRDGRIARLTEYWPELYEAPAWRAKWVEAM
jgi:ketosteroid isomerase-like protein